MAPFFAEYGNSSEATHEIRKVTADFMKYQLPDNGTKFDLLLCNQVVEHVPNPAAFTKKLNKIYGENIGIDTIRSVYLSDLYKGLPKIKELEKIATNMGHDISSAMEYYVKVDK